jgi:LPS sulfotransferase NodH
MCNQFFIAAHPRSGSTYLCRLLAQFEQIYVLLEIFHTNPDVIKQHLKGTFPKVIQKLGLSENDEFIRKEIITRNVQYTKILSDLNPHKTIVYKVFPGHLPQKHLKEQIENSKLVLLLKRNLLHSYISDVIATASQKWGGIDTTSKLATFSRQEFIQHITRTQRFHTNVENLAKMQGKKMIVINYEDLIKSKNPYIYLSDLLAGSLKLTSPITNNTFFNTLQDKRELARTKVANPVAMDKCLNSIGLSMLDNGKNFCNDDHYNSALQRHKEQKYVLETSRKSMLN